MRQAPTTRASKARPWLIVLGIVVILGGLLFFGIDKTGGVVAIVLGIGMIGAGATGRTRRRPR